MPFIKYESSRAPSEQPIFDLEFEESANLEAQEKVVKRNMDKQVDLNHASIFLIPGIHGQQLELQTLAEKLVEKSHGTQQIYIYQDPHQQHPHMLPFQSAEQHGQSIAHAIKSLLKEFPLIPPIIIGFSYGSMLASHVANTLYKANPNNPPELFVLDGSSHALSKQYHISSRESSLKDLISIWDVAAKYAQLKELTKDDLDPSSHQQLMNMLTPRVASLTLYNAILKKNEGCKARNLDTLNTLCNIINQNLDTISEITPIQMSLPKIYTLFTDSTLIKLNENCKHDQIKPHGGYEDLSNTIESLSETSGITKLSHLELLQPAGADLVATAINNALMLNLNTEKHIKERSDQWLALSAKAYTATTHIPTRFTSSSSSDDDQNEEEALTEKELPSSPPKGPTTTIKFSRKRDKKADEQTIKSSQSSDSEKSSEFLSPQESCSLSDDEQASSPTPILSNNPLTLMAKQKHETATPVVNGPIRQVI